MDVALSGASGLIGTALRASLAEAGHRPISLVRGRPQAGRDEIAWNPAEGILDVDSLEGVDAVVNLSGAGIGDRRWTDEYKRLLVSSRIDSTSLLAETMTKLDRPPSVFLSGSAIGYYGSAGSEVRTEEDGPAQDFLANLCVQWENAAAPAADAGIRTVLLRTGLVLSPDGGAMGKLLPLFKLGLGGRFGRGDQYWSWITIGDQVGAMAHLLESDVSGPVNLTAPEPVTNAEFTTTLARVLGRPAVIPVPSFGPRLILGTEAANALLFDSLRIEPRVLQGAGYDFRATDLESGLRQVLGRDDRPTEETP